MKTNIFYGIPLQKQLIKTNCFNDIIGQFHINNEIHTPVQSTNHKIQDKQDLYFYFIFNVLFFHFYQFVYYGF